MTSNYFKILGSSPVINAATPINAVPADFFQVVRGAYPDIGAQEFISNLDPTVDSIPPSAPTNLSATAISSKVNLAWTASTDNVSVAGYRIYRNSTEIGTSTVASFVDTSVAVGTTYNYSVKASDIVGNLSASSNTATVNTPLVATLNLSSYYVGNITRNSATIKWTTNIPAAGIVYYFKTGNSYHPSVSVGKATSQSVTINGLASNTAYQYQIYAWANNVTIHTPTPDPTFRTAP